jgi:lycopene cyclase domain-containing protein
MPLYLVLIICSITVPFALSFDKKVGFYKIWPFLLPSVLITAIPFILIDICFTERGIWGFNARYHSDIVIASLPLEEWLFFLVIPYASIFIHYVLQAYFPKLFLTEKMSRIISLILIAIFLLMVITNIGRAYSALYFSVMIIVLLIGMFEKKQLLKRFYISFLVILVPFLIINGILTGSMIADEVVWYNNEEITGIRIFTVPLEDFTYAFSLIMINLLLLNFFRGVFHKNQGS